MQVCSSNPLVDTLVLIIDNRDEASIEASVAVTAKVEANTMATVATARNCVMT